MGVLSWAQSPFAQQMPCGLRDVRHLFPEPLQGLTATRNMEHKAPPILSSSGTDTPRPACLAASNDHTLLWIRMTEDGLPATQPA